VGRDKAAWRHAGSIKKFQQKMIDGMLANGYERDFADRQSWPWLDRRIERLHHTTFFNC
jgi:hypothetical protein